MSAAPLPRRKRDLRREVETLRATKGVYVCGRCGKLIPLGWAHGVVDKSVCVVAPARSRG